MICNSTEMVKYSELLKVVKIYFAIFSNDSFLYPNRVRVYLKMPLAFQYPSDWRHFVPLSPPRCTLCSRVPYPGNLSNIRNCDTFGVKVDFTRWWLVGLACILSIECQDKLLCHKQKAQAFEKDEIVVGNWLLQGTVGRRGVSRVSLNCLAEKKNSELPSLQMKFY